MERFTRYVIGMVLAIALLGSMAVTLVSTNDTVYANQEAQPGKPGRGPGGEVTAIDDESLTLLTRNEETLVVTLTAETEVLLLASQTEGSLSDIAVGDQVQVRGRPDAEGTLTAEAIVVEPAGEKAGGRVTAVDGTTITVENREGTQTIVTDDTTIIRQGEEQVSQEAVSEGMDVRAFGSLQDDGTLQATLVLLRERPAGPPSQGEGEPGDSTRPQRPGRGPGGEVTAIDDESLTLLTRNEETLVVTLTAETEVLLLASQTEGSLSDIAVGDQVQVRGRPDAEGTLTAEAIVVEPAGEKAGGRVTAVDGTTITVENREGTQTIATDGTTIIRQGEEQVSQEAVSEGMDVRAFGSLQDDGTLQATLVLLRERPAGPPSQGEGEPGDGTRPQRPGDGEQPGDGTRPQRPGRGPGGETPPDDAERPAAPDNSDEASTDAGDEVYAADGEVRDDTLYFSIDQQQSGQIVFLPLMHG